MMIRSLLALAGACVLATAAPVYAQNAMRHHASESDLVTLQAEASREFENDQLVAVLAIELSGSDPQPLAEKLNRQMHDVLQLVHDYPAVKGRSGNYQTQPRYNKERIEGWVVSQELRLESRDFAAASKLIGQLQKTMLVQSMGVRLSPEARRAAEASLIAEAIAAFQSRAELVARSMKAPGYRMRSMNIGTGGGFEPRPMMSMAARAEKAAPVSVEGGSSRVQVTVSGSVQLKQ
jgi:predicted secreted protein